MSSSQPADRSARAWPIASWVSAAVLAASLVCLFLQLSFVQPWLPPAGHGMTVTADPMLAGSGARDSVTPRPPAVGSPNVRAPIVQGLRPSSPGALAGFQQGDRIVFLRNARTGRTVDLMDFEQHDARTQMQTWRAAYLLGVRGPLEVAFVDAAGVMRQAVVPRPAVWQLDADAQGEWILRHAGRMVLVALLIGAPVILLLLRPRDGTARLMIVTLALCGVSSSGPLMGSERVLGAPLGGMLTILSWMSTSIALPFVAVAIAYFPQPGVYLRRRPWLVALPFVIAAPLLVAGAGTALYLAGLDAAEPLATWDAQHSRVYFFSFAIGLGLNVLAAFDAWRRLRLITDRNEVRRLKFATFMLLPGVVAYGIYEGIPTAAAIVTGSRPELPHGLVFILSILAGLPAVALTYVVAVHRVMSPAVVLRRGLQYALARRTLGLLLLLPAVALTLSLVRQRDLTLGAMLSGRPIFYGITIGLLVLGFRYRAHASAWLDRRFFREQYDTRQVLLSLAARIPFETNPRELTALVVRQIEAALHPRKVAVLVSGLEDGKLTPAPGVAEHARALPQSGALATMLRWSEEPLELDVHDTRSPARRLPTGERSWLTDTGTVLLVPVFAGQDNERVLIGALGLGEKMSEEPYTGEDKELLSSIAAQVGLALDAARLRMAQAVEVTESSATTITPMPVEQLVECPECGRCESAGTTSCAADGSVMRLVPGLPRAVDSKYRIDQVLGRGGMGAVYRARDVRLERDVALKVVRLELLADPDARTRFRREAQIIARLQHPSLVSVFDYGTLSDGGAFLVMEFVEGRDLRTLLRSERRLEPVRTARLMRAVCDGMDVAHRAGVLHRDLKPENIFLPETGVEAKVLDFGIAKVIGDRPLTADHETLTVAGQPIGTPAYMAPEQLTGEMLSPQTDVFSLGVIAFELLTGELPFGRGSLLDIATRQQEGPPLIDGAALHIPPGVGGVVRAALQVMPGDRPTSPGLFADALTAAMDGAPS